MGRCWVASKSLDAAVAAQLQKALLELQDPHILHSLSTSEGDVNGFKTMDDEALGPLRNEIMPGALKFDAGKKD